MNQFEPAPVATKRDIPSLDGLRAFSVLFVILGHSDSPALRFSIARPLRDGGLGVTIFFVISGFLITHLLLRDLNTFGRVHLKQFYVKRILRILPPLYAYLAFVGILSIVNIYPVTVRSFASAATFTWNYNMRTSGWVLGHLWSLSLEEQFYMIWPLVLNFFPRRTCLRVAVWTICLAPASRVLTYFLLPAYRSHIAMMLHTRIDTIMLGCIFALAIDSGFARQLLAHFAKSYALVAAVIYMFFVSPYLAERFAGSYWLPLGFTLQGVSALILLIYVTSRPKSHLGTVLNNRFIKFIGVLSYSLYLWQQMFTGANTRDFPMNLVIILAFGLTSYFLVEKPALSLRSAFLHGASQGAEGRITAAA